MIVASTLASASRGVDIASTRALLAAEVRLGGSGPCGLWFGAGSMSPDRAARVNAVASDAAASDDSDLRSIAHIGTPTTAAGLAVAQWRASSGRELLGAMVMGYEIAVGSMKRSPPGGCNAAFTDQYRPSSAQPSRQGAC
jgi:2-methylcitrate dehydratase PrpD